MRALVTTSRMPCAIDEIRKLGSRGHAVIAADTFRAAPGSHSRYVEKARVTASPRLDPSRFIGDVTRIVLEDDVDLVLPAFEEVFYLARHRSKLPPSASYFFPDLETLRTLHDKAAFVRLATDLGLRAPRTVVVESPAELSAALRETTSYFAKPAFSRGGVDLLTNTGPLAGALPAAACRPSPSKPWVVQEFVSGTDVCTFSVVNRGKITGHSTYVHPREIEHAGGIVFESVDEPECLRAAARVAEATRYHGQLSLDFLRTDRGLIVIECNPRPTAGVHVMSAEMFEEALLDVAGAKLRVAPAGTRGKYGIALVRDMFLHWREAREDAKYLFSDVPEIVAEPGDVMPALYQVLSYGRVLEYRRQHRDDAHKNRELMMAYFDDVSWNGEALAELEARRPNPGDRHERVQGG